jgi:hypothetical protein
MSAVIFDKTDQGREEILTRKYQLASRLRSLLVIIDGKKSRVELLSKVSGLGLNEASLQELLDQKLIVAVERDQPGPELIVKEVSPTPELPQTQEHIATDLLDSSTHLDLPVLSPFDTAARFQALYIFYNETIKDNLGLRGYGLQLKVERAASIEDFHALRHAYIVALLKAKGEQSARQLRDQLDQLLYNKSSPVTDDTVTGEQ